MHDENWDYEFRLLNGDALPRDAVVVQPWALLPTHLSGTFISDAGKGRLLVKQQMNSICLQYDVLI